MHVFKVGDFVCENQHDYNEWADGLIFGEVIDVSDRHVLVNIIQNDKHHGWKGYNLYIAPRYLLHYTHSASCAINFPSFA